MVVLYRAGNVPDRQDIDIYRGSDFILPFAVTDEVGAARSIDGYLIAAQLRRFHLGPLVASFSVVVEDAYAGHFYIMLSAAQTLLLKCGELPSQSASKYAWDMRVQSPAPENLSVFIRHGEASVSSEVTSPF